MQALFAVVVLAHLAVLYSPSAPSTGGVTGLDKVVHLAVFAAPVWVGRLAGVPLRVLLTVAVVHAPLSEALQHWALPGRSGDPLDAVADLAGALLGALLSLPRGVTRAPRGAAGGTMPG